MKTDKIGADLRAAFQQQRSEAQNRQAEQDKPAHGRRGDSVFHHVRGQPSPGMQASRRQLRNVPLRPRRPSSRGAQQAQMENQHDEDIHLPTDDEGGTDSLDPDRRKSAGASGQFSEQAAHSGDDGRGRELFRQAPQADKTAEFRVAPRRPASARQFAAQLIQAALPGTDLLFGPPRQPPASPQDLLVAFVSLLKSAAGRSQGSGTRPLPSLTAITLAAVEAHLGRQGSDAPAMSLRDVKALLLSLQRDAGGAPMRPQGERAENTALLLPLLALNSARPRKPVQHAQAMDRLALMRASRGV